MNTISPNMGLTIPGVGTEYSPTWATDLNASLSVLDAHNHSPGQGVQINPSGIDINAALVFNNQQATGLAAVLFTDQTSLSTLNALYTIAGELWYNDGTSPVQITSGGSLAVTSSGISSGTASAAFSSSILVVKSSSSSGANILMESAVLTNSGNLSNQLTLQAPTLSGSYSLTLPALPSFTSFVQISASGVISPSVAVSQGITQGMLALRPVATIVGAGGVAISTPVTSFSTTSTSYVNVTNLSVTITTTGRPIWVGLQSASTSGGSTWNSGSSSGNNAPLLQILNGSTPLAVYLQACGNTAVSMPLPSLLVIDTSGAGTYTYTVQVKNSVAGNVLIDNVQLVAYEL